MIFPTFFDEIRYRFRLVIRKNIKQDHIRHIIQGLKIRVAITAIDQFLFVSIIFVLFIVSYYMEGKVFYNDGDAVNQVPAVGATTFKMKTPYGKLKKTFEGQPLT